MNTYDKTKAQFTVRLGNNATFFLQWSYPDGQDFSAHDFTKEEVANQFSQWIERCNKLLS